MVKVAELLTEGGDFSPETSLVSAKWEMQCCILKLWVELLPSKPGDHCKETDEMFSKEESWLRCEETWHSGKESPCIL